MNLQDYNVIDIDAYNNKINVLNFKPNSVNLPKYIRTIIHDNNLKDVEDVDERAKLFIKLLYNQKLNGTTVMKYFNKIKPILFPNTTIIPNCMVFDKSINDENVQMRGVNFSQVQNMINYIITLDDSVIYKWAILFAYYTGLRSSEVMQLKNSHIIELLNGKSVLNIKRKNGVEWEVLYYDEFVNFIKNLRKVFKKECDFYIESKIEIIIFNFTNITLHNKLKQYYIFANDGQPPPLGFGIHVFRYYVGSKLAINTNKLDISQKFLGHKKIQTTEKYIRYNNVQKQKELDVAIEQSSFYSDINNILSKNNVQNIDINLFN